MNNLVVGSPSQEGSMGVGGSSVTMSLSKAVGTTNSWAPGYLVLAQTMIGWASLSRVSDAALLQRDYLVSLMTTEMSSSRVRILVLLGAESANFKVSHCATLLVCCAI